MIIVSQNENMIVNYNNVCVLGIGKNPNKEILSITNNGDTQTLGTYATKERAKEVLQEIIQKYLECNNQCGPTGMGYVMNEIYEMPKE